MAKRRNSDESGIFQKIGMLSDLTNALTNEELKGAFEGLGNNGNRLYEIFATAVYDEIETLMKGEEAHEEAPQIMNDVTGAAYQLHAMVTNLMNMMVQLGATPILQPLNFVAERLTGTTYNPQYVAQAVSQEYYAQQPPAAPVQPQYQQPAPPPQRRQQPAAPAPRPQQPRQPTPEEYEEDLPQAPPPRRQQAAPPPQQPQPQPAAPQQPPKRRQYGEQPQAPQQPRQPPGPAAVNRPAGQPPRGNGPAAPALPPRGNRIQGLY